jgi:hypothetical protein
MTDILLLITGYLLLGVAAAMWLSRHDDPAETGSAFWLAFVTVVTTWPAFVVAVVVYWWRHRNVR